jgi:glycosyltransferase involved in cell wall biosynthesis
MSNLQRSPTVAMCMMVKNEEKRLRVSLESVKEHVDALIIYDTGSTDSTLSILDTFSKESKIPLHIKQGEFVDFSVSRNVLLEFANTINIDYLLLLDCNDELKGGEFIRDELKKYPEKEAFLLFQEWLAGTKTTKYRNVRLIKNKVPWTYKKTVHEYISRDGPDGEPNPVKLDPRIIIYQDRNKDDDKTSKRFRRDKDLLLKAVDVPEPDSRDVFYLAQTFACLQEHEDAVKWYLKRADMEGFWEEKFQANLRAGDIYLEHLKDWNRALPCFMKALEIDKRVEPLVKIGSYYRNQGQFLLSHLFLKLATELPYPEYATLFVEKSDYDYQRWHLLGIVSYYVHKDEDGEKAARMALATGIDAQQNEQNLKFYIERREKEEAERQRQLQAFNSPPDSALKNIYRPGESKLEFTHRRHQEIKLANPRKLARDIDSQISREWSFYRKKLLSKG